MYDVRHKNNIYDAIKHRVKKEIGDQDIFMASINQKTKNIEKKEIKDSNRGGGNESILECPCNSNEPHDSTDLLNIYSIKKKPEGKENKKINRESEERNRIKIEKNKKSLNLFDYEDYIFIVFDRTIENFQKEMDTFHKILKKSHKKLLVHWENKEFLKVKKSVFFF